MTRSRRPSWIEGLEQLSLGELAGMVQRYLPEADSLLQHAEIFPEDREDIRECFIEECVKRNLRKDDAMHPHPSREQLEQGEIPIGTVPNIGEFRLSRADLPTGALVLGAPKAGKTTFIFHLIIQCLRFRCGCFVPDRRGDYFKLASRIPGAVLIPFEQERLNIFEIPEGLTLTRWVPILAARLTYDLKLEFASFAYCLSLLHELYRRAKERGVLPTLIDFAELLERQHPTPRSSEEGYLQRLKGRILAIIGLLGEDAVSVQRGYPVEQLVQQGRLVVKDLRVDERVADFISSLHLCKMYYLRIHLPELAKRTSLVILDEARSLVRSQTHEIGIPDIEHIFTRSRYTSLGIVCAEQVPSAISPALVQAAWLKLAFNCSPPESLYAGKLLGLSEDQTEMLSSLPVGRCLARLAGDRLPHPFLLDIAYPDVLR